MGDRCLTIFVTHSVVSWGLRMAMDRAQLLLVGLPLFLFCSDVFNLFAPALPKQAAHRHHSPPQTASIQQPLDFPTQKAAGFGGGIGLGNTVQIDFCASCSYRGNAETMKKMLESGFPGVNVVLANYPPALPKRLLGKLVPVVQFGVIGVVMAGEHIFQPRLGFAAPPPWYYSMRANRFGTISSTWLLGNFLQGFLQSTGAFEVSVNGELVYSKLREKRFPGEIELQQLVSKKIVSSSRVVDGF